MHSKWSHLNDGVTIQRNEHSASINPYYHEQWTHKYSNAELIKSSEIHGNKRSLCDLFYHFKDYVTDFDCKTWCTSISLTS